jgi:MoxR-like ATPase
VHRFDARVSRRSPVISDLARVRAALDAAVVGHGDAKTVLLLGWLARVHVVLEGPPGCGKSALATAFAGAVGAIGVRPHGVDSLATGSVLHRERAGSVERIRLERAPFETPSVLLLDDVDRMSGELDPRLLAQLDRDDGPLAIATRALGERDEAKPVLQALLERFALRVRMRGLIDAWREPELRALVDSTPEGEANAGLGPERAEALRARARGVEIPDSVLDAAARSLAGQRGAGLVDPLARALPRLLRGCALLRGSDLVEPADLVALLELLSSATHLPNAEGASAREAAPHDFAPGRESEARDAGDGAGRPDGSAGLPPAVRDRALASATVPAPTLEAPAVEELVSALAGRWERGRSKRHPDASGAPRRRRALRDLSESVDADPAELCAYLDAESPERPAVLQRERRGASPALLILRDVSASMQGPGARWSLRLVRALVEAARVQRLRVGYLEFNHAAERFTLRDRFVHRAYIALQARAAQAVCSGRTSYQAALGAALSAHVPRACDVVLISDGVPVLGDPLVRQERRLARRRGWKLHTVFVGLPPVPPILIELARETDGLAFCVAPGPRRDRAGDATWSLRQLAGHGR